MRVKRVFQVVYTIALMCLMMFLIKGDTYWPNDWMFVGIYTSFSLFNLSVLFRKNPSLLIRRSKKNLKNVKKWDIILMSFYTRFFILTPTVAAFDLYRLSHIRMKIFFLPVGVFFIFAGQFLGSFAILNNNHYETFVRIQTELDHKVISEGPYRTIRHPGYLSLLLTDISIPLILQSYWAIYPSLACILLIIIRTILEDNTLKSDRNGYAQYALKVRYKMVPYVW